MDFLDQARQWADGESPMDYLQQAIISYASAIKIKPKDPNLHLQLGMLLEEKYYIEDMFGLKKEVISYLHLDSPIFCMITVVILRSTFVCKDLMRRVCLKLNTKILNYMET